MYRTPPTSAGGVLLRYPILQLYAVLSALLLALICGLLLLPHQSNDPLHLLGTETVPHSSKITLHCIKLRVFGFRLFQLSAQMAGSFLLVLIEVLVSRLDEQRSGSARSSGLPRGRETVILPGVLLFCYFGRQKAPPSSEKS